MLSELPLQPEEFPYCLEAGSPNTFGLALLGESVGFILQHGVPWIRTREIDLTRRLLAGLSADDRLTAYGPLGLEQRVAVVSVNARGRPPEAVGEALQRVGIAVRTGLHCAPGAHRALGTFPHGTVRISPGYFTTETDVDLCLEALRQAADQTAFHACADTSPA